MQAKVYNQSGQETGTTDLPAAVFGLPWNADLVHQVVTSMQSNQRTNRAQVKNRGDVRGGGKKPWQQKGTGRARHGSSRSPIWRGGGATHGPTTDRNYFRIVDKRMKEKALHTILSQKWRDGEILLVKTLTLAEPKTKLARETLKTLATVPGFTTLSYQQGKRALITLPAHDRALTRSFRNLPSVSEDAFDGLDPITPLTYKYVVIVEPTASLS